MFVADTRRNFLRRSIAGPTIFSLSACSQPGDASFRTRVRQLETTLPGLMRSHRVPGLSMAIVQDARLAWSRGFGVQDANSNSPVDAATMFEAASMSKPVFAYVVMKLCERGIISLDTPLTRYTSARIIEGDPALDLITARHLLSHSSGFQDIRSGANPLRIHFPPGTKWQYSGEGYAWLQSVITERIGHADPTNCSTYEADLRVCATDFDRQMRASLLAPFGMMSSVYVWRNVFSGHMARPHNAQGKPLTPGKYTAPDAARYGAMGGLLTSAADYSKFLIELIDPRAADASRLTPASLTEMLRPQVSVQTGEGFAISWALGWKVAQTSAFGTLISHGGDQAGFHSLAEFSPAGKSGYVIFTNGENGWKLIGQLAPDVARWIHFPPNDPKQNS